MTVEEVNDFLRRDFGGTTNTCEEVGEGWAVGRIDVTEANHRPGGIISGPTMFGICDAALYYACFTMLGISPMTVTSELSIRFLRAASGTQLRARADIVKAGRRAIVGNIVAWTDDPAKPVAVAQGTYVPPSG